MQNRRRCGCSRRQSKPTVGRSGGCEPQPMRHISRGMKGCEENRSGKHKYSTSQSSGQHRKQEPAENGFFGKVVCSPWPALCLGVSNLPFTAEKQP